jgi:hypothetical protein
MRPRRYVSRTTLVLSWPFFRYSMTRDARVLRVVGNGRGPVLKLDRRRRRPAQQAYDGVDRRTSATVAA